MNIRFRQLWCLNIRWQRNGHHYKSVNIRNSKKWRNFRISFLLVFSKTRYIDVPFRFPPLLFLAARQESTRCSTMRAKLHHWHTGCSSPCMSCPCQLSVTNPKIGQTCLLISCQICEVLLHAHQSYDGLKFVVFVRAPFLPFFLGVLL